MTAPAETAATPVEAAVPARVQADCCAPAEQRTCCDPAGQGPVLRRYERRGILRMPVKGLSGGAGIRTLG